MTNICVTDKKDSCDEEMRSEHSKQIWVSLLSKATRVETFKLMTDAANKYNKFPLISGRPFHRTKGHERLGQKELHYLVAELIAKLYYYPPHDSALVKP